MPPSLRLKTPPTYFATPADFRAWFAGHAATSTELLVGFMKRGTGQPSITWPESVDEALCFGWIDGVRRRIDDERYTIRFTPRKASSHWSAVNIARMAVLQAEGRMTPAGLAAFERRTEARSRQASYEQLVEPELAADELRQFKRNKAAWAYFQARAASYRRKLVWWVVKARQPATRVRRMARVIQACEAGEQI